MWILYQTWLCDPLSQWSVACSQSPIPLFTNNPKQELSPLGKARGDCAALTCRLVTNLVYRFILSDTQELHEHILTMSQRIRQLEDALEVATNRDMASGIHPLLSDDLLTIKFGPEPRANGELSTDSHEDGPETDRSLSTPSSLFECHDGSSKYFGFSGGSGESLYPAAFNRYCLRQNQETVLSVCPSILAGFRSLRLYPDWE